MSLMRLCDEHPQSRSEGHLYELKDTLKNYPTCFALLNVGFTVILRRAGWYVLIWARTAVPANLQLSSFQTSQLLEQNLKNYFSVIVLCQCCSRNDASEAVWQVSPSSQRRENGLPCGSRILLVSRDKRVNMSLTRSRCQRSKCRRFLKSLQVLGLQGSRDPGSIVRFKVLGGHLKWMVSKFLVQCSGLLRVKGFQDMQGYIFNISPGHKGKHMQSIFFFFEIQGHRSYQRMLLYSAPVYPRVLAISRPI